MSISLTFGSVSSIPFGVPCLSINNTARAGPEVVTGCEERFPVSVKVTLPETNSN